MPNIATIDRLKLIEAFKPPKKPRSARSEIPKTSIITYEDNFLMIEGAFITIGVECIGKGRWDKKTEVITKLIYNGLLKVPKVNEVTIYIEDGKFCVQADRFFLSIPAIRIT